MHVFKCDKHKKLFEEHRQLVEHIKTKLESHIKKEQYFECKECDDAFKSNIDEKYGPLVVYKDK